MYTFSGATIFFLNNQILGNINLAFIAWRSYRYEVDNWTTFLTGYLFLCSVVYHVINSSQ